MHPRSHAGLSALNEKATQCCQEELKKKKTKKNNKTPFHDPVLVYLYLYFFLSFSAITPCFHSSKYLSLL